jgi:hypothetical protein
MTHEQALNNIEQALNLATQKGAFSLAETQIIIQSLLFLKDEAGGDKLPEAAKAKTPGKA